MLQEQPNFSPKFQRPLNTPVDLSKNSSDEHSANDSRDNLAPNNQNCAQNNGSDAVLSTNFKELGNEVRSSIPMASYHLIQKWLNPVPKLADKSEISPEENDEEIKNDEDQLADPNLLANQTSLSENLSKSVSIKRKIASRYFRKSHPQANLKSSQNKPSNVIELERSEPLASNSKYNSDRRKHFRRRRRTHFTAKRRTTAMRRKKEEQKQEQETDFSFDNLAVLDIMATGNDPWEQGMHHIVELKSSIKNDLPSWLSSRASLKINAKIEHRQDQRRSNQKPRHFRKSALRKTNRIRVDGPKLTPDIMDLSSNIKIQSTVTDISPNGVVSGILIINFGQSGSNLNNKRSQSRSESESCSLNENLAKTSQDGLDRDNSNSNSYESYEDEDEDEDDGEDEDEDSQSESFTANDLELNSVSKKVKKEQQGNAVGNMIEKFLKPKTPVNTGSIKVKTQEDRKNNSKKHKNPKKANKMRDQRPKKLSIHAVNRLFEMNPIDVEFS